MTIAFSAKPFKQILMRPGGLILDIVREGAPDIVVCGHGFTWGDGSNFGSPCQDCTKAEAEHDDENTNELWHVDAPPARFMFQMTPFGPNDGDEKISPDSELLHVRETAKAMEKELNERIYGTAQAIRGKYLEEPSLNLDPFFSPESIPPRFRENESADEAVQRVHDEVDAPPSELRRGMKVRCVKDPGYGGMVLGDDYVVEAVRGNSRAVMLAGIPMWYSTRFFVPLGEYFPDVVDDVIESAREKSGQDPYEGNDFVQTAEEIAASWERIRGPLAHSTGITDLYAQELGKRVAEIEDLYLKKMINGTPDEAAHDAKAVSTQPGPIREGMPDVPPVQTPALVITQDDAVKLLDFLGQFPTRVIVNGGLVDFVGQLMKLASPTSEG